MPDRMQILIVGTVYPVRLILPFIQRKYEKKVQRIPEINDIVFLMSAVDLAELIRIKKISSLEVTQKFINRINVVNPILNAVIEDRFDAALEDARNADILIAQLSIDEMKEKFPLLGVPFTVKEAAGVKGMSCHNGETYRNGLKANDDGVAVRYLREAGAIPLLVSNMPEWGLSWETHNLVTGRTLNPYNTARTPGGSSGGEAALISSGASIFGIGTDLMGSLRIPPMFTGIFGHRPTGPVINLEGVIPYFPEKEIQEILVVGPISRYAKDLPILMKIMAGPNKDLLNLDTPVDIKSLKIYYPEKYDNSLECVPTDKEIIDAVFKSVKALEHKGAEIEAVDLFSKKLYQMVMCKFMDVDYQSFVKMSSIPNTRWAVHKEIGKWITGSSKHCITALISQLVIRQPSKTIGKADRIKYCTQCDELGEKLKKMLDENSVLIVPTFPTAAFKHYDSLRSFPGINFILLASIFNFPATAVPMGLNKDGMPIGVQVIAGKYQDRLCLAVAQYLEKKFGGWVPPPSK